MGVWMQGCVIVGSCVRVCVCRGIWVGAHLRVCACGIMCAYLSAWGECACLCEREGVQVCVFVCGIMCA